jgi:hypothetical protein
MNVDAYTKGVLTVIAVCLVWMCINGATPIVRAQAKADRPEPMPVILVDPKGTPIYTSEGFRVNLGTRALPVIVNNASLPVEITNPSLTVAVRSIQRGTAWDPIQVQVMREPPTLRPVP